MPAGRVNIAWTQGTTFRKAFAARSGSASGPAKDLTGWGAVVQVRRRTGDVRPILTARTDENSPWLYLDEEAGVLHLSLPAEFSMAPRVRRGVYGINLIDPEGEAVPFLEGTWTIRARPVR